MEDWKIIVNKDRCPYKYTEPELSPFLPVPRCLNRANTHNLDYCLKLYCPILNPDTDAQSSKGLGDTAEDGECQHEWKDDGKWGGELQGMDKLTCSKCGISTAINYEALTKENEAELYCPKCKEQRQMVYDGNWECSECGYQFAGNPPSIVKSRAESGGQQNG